MQRVLDEANDGPEYLHISFDIDVMDPAYTSGTGTPGLSESADSEGWAAVART